MLQSMLTGRLSMSMGKENVEFEFQIGFKSCNSDTQNLNLKNKFIKVVYRLIDYLCGSFLRLQNSYLHLILGMI